MPLFAPLRPVSWPGRCRYGISSSKVSLRCVPRAPRITLGGIIHGAEQLGADFLVMNSTPGIALVSLRISTEGLMYNQCAFGPDLVTRVEPYYSEDIAPEGIKRGSILVFESYHKNHRSNNKANSSINQSPKMTITITVEKDGYYEVNGTRQEPTVSLYVIPAASKLRRMLKDTKDLIVCPGVYDGLSARVAMEVGFKGLYMTGAGTTASRLGMADLGLAQLHDMKTNAEMIANLDPFGPPLIADMDTGYGGPLMVSKSVQQYIQAGVAGFHIEDQISNKRCGHLAGKKVVSLEEYLMRIRAAKLTKDRLHSDIVLIARTDALQQHGYEECIRRLRAARDIGADVGLLEGFTSKEQARQAVQDLAPWPLLLNMVENGATPLITTKEAEDMGFRIMIFSFATITPAYLGIKATLERLKTEGVVGVPDGVGPRKLFEVCGLMDSMKIDTESGNDGFSEGV
ncbi:hypothetical protein PENANT_c021G00185 [Penicillium antarcticum]|uniref:Uncharacterized protein n=2 Tax=Penicillium antarcticum TaxID=416450 RepID=A0A1V6Q184_9EURO|nr:hypothetical protein PENANT_c021G00185 [Penicillium antarcticum]